MRSQGIYRDSRKRERFDWKAFFVIVILSTVTFSAGFVVGAYLMYIR